MEPNGHDDGRDGRLRLDARSPLPADAEEKERHISDVVFDFSGMDSPSLTDLALVLTARLGAAPGDRVWARALPLGMWNVLRALGLDHLFRFYPGSSDELN